MPLVTAIVIAAAAVACSLNLDYLESRASSEGGAEREGAAPDVLAARDSASQDAETGESQADGGAGVEGGADVDASTDVATGNLIQNPGFELGTSPWTTFADGASVPVLATSSALAHTGMFSGRVSNRTRNYQGTAQDITQAVTQGHTYAASAWALIMPGADGASPDATVNDSEPVDITATYGCLVDGAVVASYIRVGAATANASTWTKIFGTFSVPTCTMTIFQVYVEGPAPGVDLYVDDVSVTP